MSLGCQAGVYLVAENRLLREALVRLLAKKDIQVVGANPFCPALVREIAKKKPEVILLDSSGLLTHADLIPSLRSASPGVKIVMVDMDSDEQTFLRAVREGVVGYVLKDASASEVAAAIRSVAAGEAVCPPGLSVMLFRAVAQLSSVSPTLSMRAELGLSRREKQLVELLTERLTNKEIAAKLNLSEQTVKNHVHNILRKLGATDRVGIVEICGLSASPAA